MSIFLNSLNKQLEYDSEEIIIGEDTYLVTVTPATRLASLGMEARVVVAREMKAERIFKSNAKKVTKQDIKEVKALFEVYFIDNISQETILKDIVDTYEKDLWIRSMEKSISYWPIESLRYGWDDPEKGIKRGEPIYKTDEEREQIAQAFLRLPDLTGKIFAIEAGLKKKKDQANGQIKQLATQLEQKQ